MIGDVQDATKMGQGYELDHKQPLCDNGSDDMDNMQPLCLPCHAEKCSEERRNIYGKTMYSELNIDVLEGLMDAPKPKQIYIWRQHQELPRSGFG